VLPNVPTAIEQGFDVEAYTWNAFFLPRERPTRSFKGSIMRRSRP